MHYVFAFSPIFALFVLITFYYILILFALIFKYLDPVQVFLTMRRHNTYSRTWEAHFKVPAFHLIES